VLASGEAQECGFVGAWLPLAGAFEEFSGLGRDEHLVGETGQARELLGRAHRPRACTSACPTPIPRGGGVDITYRGQTFF